MSQQVQYMVDSALPLLIKAINTDDNKEAVTAAVRGCGVILAGAWEHACQQFIKHLVFGAGLVETFS